MTAATDKEAPKLPETDFTETPWLDPQAVPFIQIKSLSKEFDDFTAVDSISLDIYQGELFTILGGSGCGKSTLLRMLAGFENPSAGQIIIDGVDISDLPAYDRPVNMMFQSYAVFPHMTVAQNIAYGLKKDRLPNAEINSRVQEMLELVQLQDLAARKPKQLSGGQCQRVALARALIKRPKVLLLDEPLAALDKKLREQTQFELINLQHKLGTTFIVVTHDQEEAMRMSDRIAVFNAGSIEQIGTPQEVYERPQTKFVASFLGVSNIFSGQEAQDIFGTSTMVNIRPERVKLVPADTALKADESGVIGTIIEASYIGATTIYLVQTQSGHRVIATRLNEELPDQINRFKTGDRVGALWKSDHSAVIPT